MQTCRTKEINKCFYLTKENRDEFLKECRPDVYDELKLENVHIENYDNYFTVSIRGIFRPTFYYDYWYVEENFGYDYPKFIRYTQEEFNEEYELIKKGE